MLCELRDIPLIPRLFQGLDDDSDEDAAEVEVEQAKPAARQSTSSPAHKRKQVVQDRRSRTAEKSKRVASPVSDTTLSEDDAPPQATLDESMTDDNDELTDDGTEMQDPDDEVDLAQRKRSVVVPTPRVPRATYYELPPAQSSRHTSVSLASRAGSEIPAQRPLASRLGLDPKRVAVMQASFFGSGKDAHSIEAPRPSPIKRAVSPVAPPEKFAAVLPPVSSALKHI